MGGGLTCSPGVESCRIKDHFAAGGPAFRDELKGILEAVFPYTRNVRKPAVNNRRP